MIIILLLIVGVIALTKSRRIMMRWFFVKFLRNFFLKIFLLMIVPILLIIKLGWESILPIIIYLQLLLIEAQVEIAMRQNVLISAQFEPSFDIREESSQIITGAPQPVEVFSVYIRNISKYPAYNLGLGRILNAKKRPIYPAMWPKFLINNYISCLSPDQEVKLYSIDPNEREKILENELTFEILYFNRFGEIRTFRIKFSKTSPPLLIHEEFQKPGFLLNTLEEIAILWNMYKFRQK